MGMERAKMCIKGMMAGWQPADKGLRHIKNGRDNKEAIPFTLPPPHPIRERKQARHSQGSWPLFCSPDYVGRGTAEGFPNGGLTFHVRLNFVVAPTSPPGQGVKMGGIDAESHEESKHNEHKTQKHDSNTIQQSRTSRTQRKHTNRTHNTK